MAAKLYREVMAPEGHRNYPLREVKPLRRSADLLLPIAPFLDDWGATLSLHPALSDDDRAEVMDALVKGCRKIPGQLGYYRALAGWRETNERGYEKAAESIPNATRRDLRDAGMRQRLAVARVSFESAMKKKRAIAARPVHRPAGGSS